MQIILMIKSLLRTYFLYIKYSSYLVVYTFFVASCSNKKEAALVFQNRVYDFGTIPKEQEVHAIFRFTNSSDETILIEDMSVDCDCLVLNESNKQISPNSKDSIVVRFDTYPTLLGDQHKLISMRLDTDPKIIMLEITGTVTQ